MAARSDNTPLACLRIGFKSSDSDERVLRTARDDEEERGFTTSNIEKAKSLFSSSKLSQESLQRWAKLGKTPDKVFLRLKLDKAGVKLLDKPNFLVWVKYVDDFNAQNSAGMTASMVSILTTRYGDDGLAKILVAAKAAPDTKDIATKLLAEQSQRWLSGGKSADAVFALLGLDSGVKKLLESKVLSVWIDYMKLFNSANPDEKASVITTFTKAYGDLRLAKMLDAAATVSTTARIAKRVQTEQIQRWIGDKRSPDDIFCCLSCKTLAINLLKIPC
ncbi:hypothetical protein ON010_g17692 [Phytophthora cinnamomi]|nr:hypothetical protein ON010_g17692 [Phytophthora cinnamomi]